MNLIEVVEGEWVNPDQVTGIKNWISRDGTKVLGTLISVANGVVTVPDQAPSHVISVLQGLRHWAAKSHP